MRAAVAALVLACLLAGCQAAATGSPSFTVDVTFNCQSPDDCLASSKQAVLDAVTDLGYRVTSVTIGIYGLSCGAPFPSAEASCPLETDPLPTAYVAFVGTDKVAAVQVGTVTGGPGTDSVVAFEVPRQGWSLP